MGRGRDEGAEPARQEESRQRECACDHEEAQQVLTAALLRCERAPSNPLKYTRQLGMAVGAAWVLGWIKGKSSQL
eukprot:6213395-Pleurochrysis_carterae.AAC.1